MAFKINADKYAYSAAPEKVSDNYAAELAKKLVADEEQVRQDGDVSLQNKIDIAAAEERGLRSEADRVLDERISLEVSRRASEDEALGGRISEEASARQALERSLLSRISEEAGARQNRDEELNSFVRSEVSRIDGTLKSNGTMLDGKADKEHIHPLNDIVRLMEDGNVDCTLTDILNMYNMSLNDLYTGKADKEHTHNADEVKIWNSTLDAEMGALVSYCDGLSDYKADKTEVANVQACVDTVYDMVMGLGTTISTEIASAYGFEFGNTHNKEIRLTEVSSISFTFGNGEYASDYTSGLSFDSGAVPTAIDYTDSGILNWVGTDCTNVDGLSIFQPSANTHYDIVFYFNGRQFIGLVNGFVPSTGNVVSI